MHREAWEFLTVTLAPYECEQLLVLDLGGRDANGWHHARELLPCAEYVTLDITPSEGVDIVADAAAWQPDREYDLVLCTEVFEHTPHWMHICTTARDALRDRGLFVATAATDPRAPHSAIDGWDLRPGETYDNIDPDELRDVLLARFSEVTLSLHPRGDVYATAIK